MWLPEKAHSLSGAGFGKVKHDAVGIPYVATRHGSVFFLESAAGGEQLTLGRFNVAYEKLEDGPMLLALFDIEAKNTRVEADEVFASVRDW
jgi:hypothetical protein